MNAELRAFAALALGAVSIGFAPICVRMVELEPVASAFWRLALAAPVLFLISRWSARAKPAVVPDPAPVWRSWLPWLVGLAFAADLGIWHYSIEYTSVANATLLANLAPVFIAVWTLLVLRIALGARYWLGLGLALAGCVVLVGVSLEMDRSALFGDGLGVLTAMFYAAYQMGMATARRRFNTWDLMWLCTSVSALALLPVVLLAGNGWPLNLHDWLWLIALAGISHVLGQGMITYALAHLPAEFASVSLLIQPMAAAGFAWMLLAEALTLQQALGGLVVLIGIVLCRRPKIWLPPDAKDAGA